MNKVLIPLLALSLSGCVNTEAPHTLEFREALLGESRGAPFAGSFEISIPSVQDWANSPIHSARLRGHVALLSETNVGFALMSGAPMIEVATRQQGCQVEGEIHLMSSLDGIDNEFVGYFFESVGRCGRPFRFVGAKHVHPSETRVRDVVNYATVLRGRFYYEDDGLEVSDLPRLLGDRALLAEHLRTALETPDTRLTFHWLLPNITMPFIESFRVDGRPVTDPSLRRGLAMTRFLKVWFGPIADQFAESWL